MRTLARLLATVLATAVGCAVGVAGSFFQDYAVAIGGFDLPAGLLLSLGGAVGAFVLTGMVVGNRLAVLGPGLGWVITVLTLAVQRPEGDLVVGATTTGYVFLLGGAIAIGLAVAFPYTRPAARETAAAPSATT